MIRKLIRGQAGMTLIEIMVVVTILGILATVTSIGVLNYLDKAKVGATKIKIKEIEKAILMFRSDNGFYPATEQGLKALIEKPSGGREAKRYQPGGYLGGDKVPLDTWDCEFIYYSPGSEGHPYEITSLGADCQEGGEDYDADIHSWEID